MAYRKIPIQFICNWNHRGIFKKGKKIFEVQWLNIFQIYWKTYIYSFNNFSKPQVVELQMKELQKWKCQKKKKIEDKVLNTASVKETYFFFHIRTGIRIMVYFIRNKRVHEIINNIFKVLTEKKKSVNQKFYIQQK